MARLLFLLTFHFALWLSAFGLAGGTVLGRADILRAGNSTVWLTTLHLAAPRVETFAPS